MSDWKKKVNELVENQKRVAEKLQLAKEKKDRIAIAKQAQIERERNLSELAQLYQCHICHKPSAQPLIVHGKYVDQGMGVGYQEDDQTIWDKPGDLWQCKICNEWTCQSCLHESICKNDWEKRFGQKL